MRRPERTVRRPSSAECGPDFPWDVSRNCRSEHYDGWLQHRSYKFPILFIIRFPPHAVTAIVVVHAPAEAARTKKTQKDYKARTGPNVTRRYSIVQAYLNPACHLA